MIRSGDLLRLPSRILSSDVLISTYGILPHSIHCMDRCLQEKIRSGKNQSEKIMLTIEEDTTMGAPCVTENTIISATSLMEWSAITFLAQLFL